jgi:hypothetical protein
MHQQKMAIKFQREARISLKANLRRDTPFIDGE